MNHRASGNASLQLLLLYCYPEFVDNTIEAYLYSCYVEYFCFTPIKKDGFIIYLLVALLPYLLALLNCHARFFKFILRDFDICFKIFMTLFGYFKSNENGPSGIVVPQYIQ